jgi:DNA repair and recombination RAD54-like protein
MMGLGKTLSAITLLWVMLKECKITEVTRAHKAMVVCPSSLMFHWDKELKKWLEGTGEIKHIICCGDRRDVINTLRKFKEDDNYNLIVMSYDSFRIHGKLIEETGDLLICDEGHKIKNRKIRTAVALNACATKRRVILTGTPI